MNKKQLIVTLMIGLLLLSGCAPVLIGVGIGAACGANRASNASYKRLELEAKEEYGKYRIEIQQKNLEPLTYEEWLRDQVKDPEKAKRWENVIRKMEKK